MVNEKKVYMPPSLPSMKKDFHKKQREWIEEHVESKGGTVKFDDVKSEMPEELHSFEMYKKINEVKYMEKSIEEQTKALESKKAELAEKRDELKKEEVKPKKTKKRKKLVQEEEVMPDETKEDKKEVPQNGDTAVDEKDFPTVTSKKVNTKKKG